MKKKVIHYTIGFFPYDVRGGIERAIRDFATINPDIDNIVVSKNGPVHPSQITKNIFWVRGVGESFKDYDIPDNIRWHESIPKKSQEFDPKKTYNIIQSFYPDLIIVYLDDLSQILAIKDAPQKTVIRDQTFRYDIVDFYKSADEYWLFDKETIDYEVSQYEDINCRYVPKFYNHNIFNSEGRKPWSGKNIFYAGRFNREKRVTHFFKAFDELKKEGYDIVGEAAGGFFSPTYKREFDEEEKNWVYKPKVSSWLKDHELVSRYKQADILVVPSTHETFCSMALEGLACGCMVVANITEVPYGPRTGHKKGMLSWASDFIINGADYGEREEMKNTYGVSPYSSFKRALKEVLDGKHEYQNFSKDIFERFSYERGKELFSEILKEL